MLGHTTMGGTQRLRRLAKERVVNAGTVVGLDEQLMQVPYRCTYTTASFVHLFFFDKTQVREEKEKRGSARGAVERAHGRGHRSSEWYPAAWASP